MARKGSAPRKRRTREQVFAALGVNRVERFLLYERHSGERPAGDCGCDLILFTSAAPFTLSRTTA
jgi:hypothetical protein